MSFIGNIVIHTKEVVAGWCASIKNPSESVNLQILWGDKVIRHIEAFGTSHHAPKEMQIACADFQFTPQEDLIRLLPKGTTLTVAASDGKILRHAETIKFEPIGDADDGGAALRDKLDKGWVVDKWGDVKLPFQAMSAEERAAHSTALQVSTEFFHKKLGLALFPAYGTLLGLARDSKFLPHDDDVDMSVLIETENLDDAVDRFLSIAVAMYSLGVDICFVNVGQFKARFREMPNLDIDIFLTWYNAKAQDITMYFGVHGPISGRLSFTEGMLEGSRILVPDQAEDLLSLTYGPNWRVPDPHFSWARRIAELEPLMQQMRDSGAARLRWIEETILKTH